MTNKKSRFDNKLDINLDFKIIETTKVNVANLKVENSKTYKKGKSNKKKRVQP